MAICPAVRNSQNFHRKILSTFLIIFDMFLEKCRAIPKIMFVCQMKK